MVETEWTQESWHLDLNSRSAAGTMDMAVNFSKSCVLIHKVGIISSSHSDYNYLKKITYRELLAHFFTQ